VTGLIFALGAAIWAAATIVGSARSETSPATHDLPQSALAGAPALPPPDWSDTRRTASSLPRLHSMIVTRRGQVVFDYYARGYSANRPANVKSASKSVISALVGISIERGLLRNVDQPISAFFPELSKDADRRKQAITVEHLLTMRSGLESTSGPNYGRWVTSKNWVAYALTRPMVSDPGTAMQYSTGSSHVLSALLTRASKMSTWQFAQSALAKPLGIQLARWPQDPQGIYFGGNDMLLTPRQMAAFGELYLNEGRVNGQQVVAEAWVKASCVPRTNSRFDPGREYGYGWWIDEVGGRTACYAWGFGGQFILVFDDLDLVVTATSSTDVSDERRGYRRELLALIGRIAAVMAASS
jgi:CubicO group peptidase (beta-lactamase class C family)